MKLIFEKNYLLSAINIVMKAVPVRTTMPILECILIDATSDRITFTSNDMEMGIETVVKGTIKEHGKIAIEAKLFSEIIRKLPDNEVTIETEASYQTTITCEKAKFSISAKSGEDFSYLPSVEKEKSITISQFSLREIIKQTIFCTSDNESNKIMTGELLEVNGNMFRMVSLDGHRIAIRKLELHDTYDNVKVIVPGKTLNDISRILTGGVDDMVEVYFTRHHILFEFDRTILVSRLIEGEYFRIDQMISNDYETKVTVNKAEFLSCIDRATLMLREGDKKPIIIGVREGSLDLKINTYMGSMNETLDIEKEGKDILIGFNPKFFMDALRVIDEEKVSLYMINPKAPCFIRDEEGSYIYLILPVNFIQA